MSNIFFLFENERRDSFFLYLLHGLISFSGHNCSYPLLIWQYVRGIFEVFCVKWNDGAQEALSLIFYQKAALERVKSFISVRQRVNFQFKFLYSESQSNLDQNVNLV